MLSQHDIELASLALRPGTAGIVLVTEDRWARAALRRRATRVGVRSSAANASRPSGSQSVLADRSDDDTAGG